GSPAGMQERRATAEKRQKLVDDVFVMGYVPGGNPLEPIPSLTRPPGALPTTPKKTSGSTNPGDPTVGRYVVRNDDPNWVANANELMAGLDSFFGNFFFTNSQYFWAEPFEFNTNEASFINSVNIADNAVHGDWWLCTALKKCCDLVDTTAIPESEGYGAANPGSQDYWILDACEVVPAAIDALCPAGNRTWWTPWFNVFQG